MYQMLLLYTVTLLLGVFVRENECIAVICNGLPCPSTYVTCPETSVEVMCNTTGSSTGAYIKWTLPPGSCPEKNDTLKVIVGRNQNCQDDMNSSPCGPFIQRTVPNWSQYWNYTCSSILTVPRNTSATIQCKGDEPGNDLKNITIIRNSLTLDAVSVNETAIALTWTPFNCCVATYNVTINTIQYVVPGSQQGYYIPGLKSNTLYVINLTTFYCNSSTSVYTLASPPQNVNISILMGSGILTSLNVTWTAVLAIGVSRYKVYEGSPNALGFPSANGVLCTTGTCAFLINLDTDPSGINFTVCVSSLNVVGQNGTANCGDNSAFTPGTLSRVLLNTTGESSLVLTWAPPTMGGAPVNYTLTINDSRSPVVIPDNGSPVYNYTFTGLTSNTMYSVSVMASNDGGNGNQTVVNSCTWAYPPGNATVDILQDTNIWIPSLNVTWTAVDGVSSYVVFELGSVLQITLESFLCLRSVCEEIINLEPSFSSGRSFPICVASNNVAGQSGAGTCTTKSALTPGTLSDVLLNTTGESSLVLTWAPPTMGGAPVNYTLTINDSRSPVVIPDNGSPVYSYTFTGLTSNTMYSVSAMASNDGGNGNQTVVNNSTRASPPQNVRVTVLMGSGILTSINVTWTAVIGVSRYKVYEGSPKTLGFPSANGVLCKTGTCAFLINLDTDPSGKHFTVCVSSLNVVGQNGTANCIYISGTTSAPSTPSASSTPSSLAITGFRFSEYLFRAIIPACVFVYMCVCL